MAKGEVADSDLAWEENPRAFWAIEQARALELPGSSPATVLRKETWPWGVQETQGLPIAALTATLAAMTLKTKRAMVSKDTKEAEGAAISAAHWPKSCHSK